MLRAYGVTAYVSGHDHCLYHISRGGMHYICSGGGSEVLATYTGGEESGCVFDAFCDDTPRGKAFPLWHRFVGDRGFATFAVHQDHIRVELIGLGDPDGQHYGFTIPAPSIA